MREDSTKLSDEQIKGLKRLMEPFDKSEISNLNREMIDKFVLNSVYDESTVNITGSTDNLGERQYNQSLSQKRAETVRSYIDSKLPSLNYGYVKGIGSSNLLFDNSTPEGRFYCRTVKIEVKTPINEE